MKMPHRRHRKTINDLSRIKGYYDEVPDFIKLWIYRILWDLRGHREFIQESYFRDDQIAQVMGLEEWIDSDRDDFDTKLVLQQLHDSYLADDERLEPEMTDQVLAGNVARIASVTGLDETDSQILEFAILLRNEPVLGNAADMLGELTLAKAQHAISVILDLPLNDVRVATSVDAVLMRTGVLALNRRGGNVSLRDKLEVISDVFADLAISESLEPIEMLRGQLSPTTPPELELEDFSHIEPQLKIIRPYLEHALKQGRKGVNILIYGLPGTGKSQLVKRLAKESGSKLFEVSSEDEEGDSINGSIRLRTYRAAQTFLTKRAAVLAFEEIEDVFANDNPFVSRRSGVSKAWIKKTMEENRVPTFWISNSVYCIDPAYTRRFDMVIEMPIPPKRQREQIIKKACGDLVKNEVVSRLAESEDIAPAVITRVADVVRCVKDALPTESVAESIEMMVENTLKAQGHTVKINDLVGRLPRYYDPKLINTELDLDALANGLAETRTGRICLYGPPGTGKTAYGRWLADRLEMPLKLTRASDLLSKYVGGTEQNIAKAFDQAERDEALLMIDEVDSFLQDRRGATRSWEVAQVNEFLTQMENYPGVFIASTNLMDVLDQAAMRRFDIKARFDFLTPEQAWQLLRAQCKSLKIKVCKRDHRPKLDKLAQLTPGDFAAVARARRMRPLEDAAGMIDALAGECEHKEQQHTAIGFM